MQTLIKNPNWWRRRTTLERFLILLSIFALIAVIGLIIGLISVKLSNKNVEELKISNYNAEALHGPAKEQPLQNKVAMTSPKVTSSAADSRPTEKFCSTPECIHTASAVLRKMKPEVEPCDDFYQFACGSFLNEMIPEDKVAINTFSMIGDKLQEDLSDVITEKLSETEPKHFRLPNALYTACMNKTLIESLGAKPIADIAATLGGWPVIKGDTWDADNSWTWQETVKKFRKLGLSMDYIVDFSASVDLKNSTKRVLDLDQSEIGLSREFLIKGFNETLVSAYYHYMVDMAVLFGADKERAKKELYDSLEFEIKLANISWSNEKRRNTNDLYNLRTIKQLQESYPYVQWLDYINGLLPDGLVVNENEIINVAVPSFFENLKYILKTTPKRVIANYLMWRIHSYSVVFLSEDYRKRQLQYSTALSGRQEHEARWKECVDKSNEQLEISVGALYVRKYVKENSKLIALEMINNIRAVFGNILDEIDWMDETTKKEAKKKLHAMASYIGYPDEMLEHNKLEEYYRKLDIDSDKYFESILRINIFDEDYAFNKLRLPRNKTDWVAHATPATVNAFYAAIENSIQFPAGILQGQFFHAKRPKYMNYGAIGFIMGHEITHGFDDFGRLFDQEGNLLDWWQPKTKEAYLNKTKCIIEQYGNYTDALTGLNLNGINTQGENIADNGGVKEAYIAYRRWAQEHGPELKLPGLDYTPEQMFWISAGQVWCSKYRKEALKVRITADPHSPSEFRVLGSIRNTKDFSKDFQCPEGSPMNPVKKCEVW